MGAGMEGVVRILYDDNNDNKSSSKSKNQTIIINIYDECDNK